MFQELLSFFYALYSFFFESVTVKISSSIKNVSTKETAPERRDSTASVASASTERTKEDILMEKLDLISSQLFESKQKSVMPSHYQLESAVLAVRHKELEVALGFFKEASSLAEDSFEESTSFKERALSTRLKIFCVLSMQVFYGLGEYGKQEHVISECTEILDTLVDTEDVQKALKSELQPRNTRFRSSSLTSQCSMGAMAGAKVLAEVASIIYFVEELTGFQYSIHSRQNKEQSLSLYSVQAKLKGHRKQVTCLAENGKFLLSGSKDDTIKVWDMSSLMLKNTLKGHKRPISCLVVQDDLLYSGSCDGSVKCWSVEAGKERASTPEHTEYTVKSLAVHRQSKSVFVGCSDGVVRVLNSQTLVQKGILAAHRGAVTCLAVTDSLLCSGSADASIKVWDVLTLEARTTFTSHSAAISCMAVLGDRLYSGSHDKTVRVWDLLSLNEVIAAFLDQRQCTVRSLAVTTCNKLYVGYASDNIRVISLASLEDVCDIQAKPTCFDNCMTVSDGKLFIGSAGKTIHVHLL